MKKYFLMLMLFLHGCSPSNHLKKYYTAEDKTVFELLEKLKKNSIDKEALEMLPQVYTTAANKRKSLTIASYNYLPPAERYLELAKEYGVLQQMFQQITALPVAAKVVHDLWNPEIPIQEAKNNAAREYYNQGLEYMTYDNRESARNAYTFFSEANNIIPGFKDVRDLMQEAKERATIKVIVRAANYYNRNWNYWGFQNDWLQQQIINDLNNQSFSDVRFYSDRDADIKRIHADRIVDLTFTELFVGQVYTNRYNISRSKQVQTGTTKSIPPQPVYKTIYATVNVTTRYLQSRAALECRIYDQVSGSNLLFDRFPGNDEWKTETATYSGDKNALTQDDWNKISNSNNFTIPGRNEIAGRLIRNCYSLLLNRIKNGVQFGS
jgi:hypothetical protein